MIWFACKQCGRRDGRPENSSGTMVFCACGHGNVVPWDSTVEPPPPEQQSAPPPIPPRLEPVPVGEERRPRPAPEPLERPRAGRRRDPAYCFNHTDRPFEVECADCSLRFCRLCVVEFESVTLCGPCKNQRLRNLTRPPRVAAMAVASVVFAFTAGLVALTLLATGSLNNLVVLLSMGVGPQLIAFLLGGTALIQAETRPKTGGQSLAITGMVTAAVMAILSCALTAIQAIHWV